LVNKNHRKKLEIQRHGNKNDAAYAAESLATKLGVELVQYQPKISNESKRKHR